MDAWQLRNFLMITECGSITRAADRLGIAQPSLSQQLLRLEDELGVTLFNRTARGVTATDAGRLFQEHALNILQSMQRAREEIRRHAAEPHGAVSFAMPASTGELLGVPLLIAARAKFPQVSLKLREGMSNSIRTRLDEGRLDLAILYDAERLRHMSVKYIADESLFLIGPPGEFGPTDARGIALEPVGRNRVTPASLILPTVAHGLRRLVEAQGGEQSLQLTVGIEIDSLSHIRTLVAAGQGYSLLSHAAVSEDILTGRLSAARIEGVKMRRSVSLVRNPGHPITRASVEIEDLTMKLLREMIGDGRWIVEPDSMAPIDHDAGPDPYALPEPDED